LDAVQTRDVAETVSRNRPADQALLCRQSPGEGDLTETDKRRSTFFAPALGFALAVAGATAAEAVEGGPLEQDLTRLSLEELANVEITSVSKRAEPIGQAAAAVYVITAEDIRRSGATSLPEVLRLAPNLQVQRLNSSDYAITARGFNGFETANKLLVMVDGRSIYEPLHAGIFWDARLQALHDIDRIEVISGPGGALHGANAVNGVINIITRSTQDTKGGYVEVGAGNDERQLTARYGGKLGDTGAWRAYAMGVRRDDSDTVSGVAAGDQFDGVQAGFRTDFTLANGATTFQGDAFKHHAPLGVQVEGGNFLGRWVRPLDRGGAVQLQGYLDRTRRSNGPEVESEDTFDLHFQHDLNPGWRQQWVWGGGYRHVASEFIPVPGSPAFLDPQKRGISLLDLYVQDQITIRENLTLTLGFKYEDSSLSGDEYMPSVRMAWRSPGGALAWGSISRAVRTATRIESDLTQPGLLIGGNFRSENVIAYELGYRASLGTRASFSISAFYNDYADLRSVELAPGPVLSLQFANGGEGRTYGVEAWGSYDVNPQWRLSAGVATMGRAFGVQPGRIDLAGGAVSGDDPDYQILLRSNADLTDWLEMDLNLRAVDDLEASGLRGYVEADLRFGWRVRDGVEVSLIGSNLLDKSHFESVYPVRAQPIGRSVFMSIRLER
jgi:iron complex outermembrane recepter protein